MVPTLYSDAEKEGIISSERTARAAVGLPDSNDVCWSAYVERCRANLNIVLAMSPVGEALRTRCRNFPGLINNTVINWFEPWPEQVWLAGMPTAHQWTWLLTPHTLGSVHIVAQCLQD
jgi:dynein heavy chain, axonemal